MKFRTALVTLVTISSSLQSVFASCTATTNGITITPTGATYTGSSTVNGFNAIAYSLSDVFDAITDCNYIGGAYTTLPVVSSTTIVPEYNFIYDFGGDNFWAGFKFSTVDTIVVYTAYFVRTLDYNTLRLFYSKQNTNIFLTFSSKFN